LNGGTFSQTSLVFGARATLLLPVTNTGNVPAKGTVNLELLVQTGDGSTFPLESRAGVKYSAKNGQTKNLKLQLTLPSSLPPPNGPGSYTLLVRLSSSSLGAPNSTDGQTLATVPFTIA
jgi:hypothetical protein